MLKRDGGQRTDAGGDTHLPELPSDCTKVKYTKCGLSIKTATMATGAPRCKSCRRKARHHA